MNYLDSVQHQHALLLHYGSMSIVIQQNKMYSVQGLSLSQKCAMKNSEHSI